MAFCLGVLGVSVLNTLPRTVVSTSESIGGSVLRNTAPRIEATTLPFIPRSLGEFRSLI